MTSNISAFIPKYLPAKALIFFVFVICISPTIQLLATHGNSPQTLGEYLIMLIPDISVLLIFLSLFFQKEKLHFNMYLPDYIVIGFVVINVGWGILIGDGFINHAKGFRLTYLPIAFYFLGRTWSKRDEIDTTLKSIFAIFVALALSGWIIWLFFPELTTLMYKYSGHLVAKYFIVRMTSLLWTPVLFGTLMAWASYYYFWKVIRRENNFWISAILLMITFSALVMSVSRGPLISFFCVLILQIPFIRFKKKSILVTLALILFQSLISLSVTKNFDTQKWMIGSTFSTIGMQKDVTRVNRWQQSLIDFKNRPLGYGLGSAGAVAYNNNSTKSKATLSTDGWYLKLACETGVPGLISFSVLMSVFLSVLWRNREFSIQIIGFPALGLGLMVIIQCVSSNVLDFYPYIGLFWFIIGLTTHEKP